MAESRILVLNAGSSTLKWDLYASLHEKDVLDSGHSAIKENSVGLSHLISSAKPMTCIIRVVHGGDRYHNPIEVTADNVYSFDELVELAPLHNKTSLGLIWSLLFLDHPMRIIAVFDTEFFHDLPTISQLYGLPERIRERYGVRRYGFHGFAHSAMLAALSNIAAKVTGPHKEYARVITLQLGSGCSIAAIRDGHPIDTTMGFTPNEGLLMSTRCGDIDPGLVTWLQRKEGWTAEQTDQVLNEQSGWLGVSDISSNMEDLIDSDSRAAQIAIELFMFRIRKTLGAYYVILGGLDAVLLSGGIAENANNFCRELLGNLEHIGIGLSHLQVPDGNTSTDRKLSADCSQVDCWVVPGNESAAMLRSVSQSGILA